jgi:hypothetical protein
LGKLIAIFDLVIPISYRAGPAAGPIAFSEPGLGSTVHEEGA